MPVLDFKEIPEAHLGGGLQDTFELFARDFLAYLGYSIESEPSRGADGGKDIVVVERRAGIGGETHVRWLVSCKHKAHSGSSVTPADEGNIRDRVEANKCEGFIGFYSTLPSSGLDGTLSGLAEKMPRQVFDREKIEGRLLSEAAGLSLAKRYFPVSTAAWLHENPKPAKLFVDQHLLSCRKCGKNLLYPTPSGIIVLWHAWDETTGRTHYSRVYWCCKGTCDRTLAEAMEGSGAIDGWEDIPDVAIPLVFARWMMSPLNELFEGDTYSPEAFAALKEFILSVYPFVARHATAAERARIGDLSMIPSYLGGLGA